MRPQTSEGIIKEAEQHKRDCEYWRTNYSQKYLDVMAKKCRSFNCGNYKSEESPWCPSCNYPEKPVQLSQEDMAVVRFMMKVASTEEEAYVREVFDKNDKEQN